MIFRPRRRHSIRAGGAELYSQVQHIISDDVPVLYLTELQFPTFVNKVFRSVIIDAHGALGDFDQAYKA
jgi:peptide/nickel transport system substrate-binding protein